MGVIADSERFRLRYPWDCPPGSCVYGDVRVLALNGLEYRQCLYCDWRVFRRPQQDW